MIASLFLICLGISCAIQGGLPRTPSYALGAAALVATAMGYWSVVVCVAGLFALVVTVTDLRPCPPSAAYYGDLL
jgi:hypothetical protein